MNPQSLNRYSYVLNNPLKYSDPSGHTVSIGQGELQDWIDFCQQYPDAALAMGRSNVMYNAGGGSSGLLLKGAYQSVLDADPDMAGALRGFDPNSGLGWLAGGSSSITLGGATPIALFGFDPISIGISGANGLLLSSISSWQVHVFMGGALKNSSIQNLAASLSHELFHVLQGRFSDSIEEEVGAYQYQNKIAGALGVDPGFAGRFSNINIQSNSELNIAKGIMTGEGQSKHMYGSLPYRPASNPYGEWLTLIGMLKGLALDHLGN
jgi:hypothetical protein